MATVSSTSAGISQPSPGNGATAGPIQAAAASLVGGAPPTDSGFNSQSGSNGGANSGSSAASNGASASESTNAAGVDRVRFVQRVAKAFQTVGDDGGTVRLRLSPPELGTVKLDVSVKNGSMSAQMETDTTEARDAIIANLPALRERLGEMNIQVEKFDVNVAGQSSGGASGQSSSDAAYQQADGQTAGGRRSIAAKPSIADSPRTTSVGPVSAATGQLNVLV